MSTTETPTNILAQLPAGMTLTDLLKDPTAIKMNRTAPELTEAEKAQKLENARLEKEANAKELARIAALLGPDVQVPKNLKKIGTTIKDTTTTVYVNFDAEVMNIDQTSSTKTYVVKGARTQEQYEAAVEESRKLMFILAQSINVLAESARK